ncbi:MAG: DMT family transporter [Pseudomonadota bacterium]
MLPNAGGLLIAPLFVVLWSTGFIGAKLGSPHAEPMTFLTWRFGLVVAGLALWILLSRAAWPTWRQVRDAAIIGLMVQGVYLGGVFQAISWGTEAGVSALIVGLQPVLTALIAARAMGERLTPVQIGGMLAGVAGVSLVVARKLEAGIGDWWGVGLCVLSLVAISGGAVMQKIRAAKTPMLSGNLVQFTAAGLGCGLLATAFETRQVTWHPEFIFALGWLVVVLSLGAVTLYYILIRRGGASDVASLFFLVPPATAIFAWVLFEETFGWLEMGGIALAALGVLMVNRPGLFRRGR